MPAKHTKRTARLLADKERSLERKIRACEDELDEAGHVTTDEREV